MTAYVANLNVFFLNCENPDLTGHSISASLSFRTIICTKRSEITLADPHAPGVPPVRRRLSRRTHGSDLDCIILRRNCCVRTLSILPTCDVARRRGISLFSNFIPRRCRAGRFPGTTGIKPCWGIAAHPRFAPTPARLPCIPRAPVLACSLPSRIRLSRATCANGPPAYEFRNRLMGESLHIMAAPCRLE